MAQVSVVIPVYNIEQHLRQCLDSAAAQSVISEAPDQAIKLLEKGLQQRGTYPIREKSFLELWDFWYGIQVA